jgi:hypothetical protein
MAGIRAREQAAIAKIGARASQSAQERASHFCLRHLRFGLTGLRTSAAPVTFNT